MRKNICKFERKDENGCPVFPVSQNMLMYVSPPKNYINVQSSKFV